MSINLASIFSRLFGARSGKRRPYVSPRKLNRNRKRPGRCLLGVEVLEGRVVPASPLVSAVLGGTAGTAIVGTVYEDLNSDGVRNNGENGVAGWTVYLDLDQSGTLNTDAVGDLEPSAVTNQDGDYIIDRLMPGTYRVSEVVQSGWTPTSPAAQDVAVTLNNETSVDFFNFSGGDILGTLWHDLNNDGIHDSTDPGLADWTVFLDFDNNRMVDPGEPTTLTDANGGYTFVNLPPDDYEVTVVLPDGWVAAKGSDNRQTARVVARTQFTLDFSVFSELNGSIHGTIWNDLNADGVRASDPDTGEFTEPGLAAWTVFLDMNGNGLADDGEPTTLTNATGGYFFISVVAGDYDVTEVLTSGWDVSPTFDSMQTVRVNGGEATTGVDFANFTVLNGSIRGTVWNDINRNGIRDVSLGGAYTDPALPNWTVYLDLNHNRAADPSEPTMLTDANGEYVFADLQVGDYDVRQILPSGWEVAPTFSDSETVTVYSGTESIAPDFANFNLAAAMPGSVSGVVWNDLNNNGLRNVDPFSGDFTDPGLAGWTVFIDQNSNGVLDTGEPNVNSAADGSYSFTGVSPGTVTIIEQVKSGWRATAPTTAVRTLALKNGEEATGLDFGNWALEDSIIRGVVFADTNKDGVRDAGERGLDGITIYLDLDNSGTLDAGEPQTVTSADLYFTPTLDEAGSYSFTHLATGSYTMRAILPAELSATPVTEVEHSVVLATAEERVVNVAAVFRPTEVHGVTFDDLDGDRIRDAGESGKAGVTVYVDLDRDDVMDDDEPRTISLEDGSYSFTGLAPDAYVVREIEDAGYEATYPTTTGGTLWPDGVSNPAVGNVSPTSITIALADGATHSETVSITLPGTGALTNMVDVVLLFDDTGSFTYNSPIVRAAFPDIIAQLQSSLPGIDLGFGVGRFEEYGNFAYEYATGRPFVLNQPIVAASTSGYMAAIQAALNRTAPGYGGDQPETVIEALYQLVTGLGFDGNNNGSVLDSGVAGQASTQLNPGASGDVPSFASFTADAANNVMAADGTIGGGAFRAGALPIILVATDTGFAYQPKGETTVTGIGGLSVPISDLTGTSRPTTPFNSGAGIQEMITGLNALGALVIGLGTNAQANVDPRQGLEAISKLTDAVNRSTATIANGTADPIAPGDPLYFQIASGFAGSVANGVVSAIENAVTHVAVDITVQASDPRVKIINNTGVRAGVGSGQTATFDIQFVGDGVPHRFDLQFVRNGTNVVLGSIPVVIGTPIPGDCYEFEDLAEGEIHSSADFGSHLITGVIAPTIQVTGGSFTYDGTSHAASAVALASDGVTPVAGSFVITYDGSATLPTSAGTYNVVAAFTSLDPNYSDAIGTGTLFISQADAIITVNGYSGVYDGHAHGATGSAVGVLGESLDSLLDLGVSFTNVPGGTANWSFAGDINYKSASGTASIVISQADAVITVNGYSGVYDGNAHGATGSAVGILSESLDSLLDLGVSFTNVPGGTANWSFAGDTNYKAASGTAGIVISQADAVITVNGYSGVYDGNPHGATGSAVGVLGESLDNLLVLGASFTNVPGGTANWTFAGDINHKAASGTASIVLSAVTPVFGDLSSPKIVVGAESAIVSGHINAGSAFPVGDAVSITANGVTHPATVDSTGYFWTRFMTSQWPLSGSPYLITYSYAGDGGNFTAAADATSVLTVSQLALNDGLLDIAGTAKADNIRIDVVGTELVVTMNRKVSRYNLDEVDLIHVHAGDGNDRITLTSRVFVPAEIYGDTGNDSIMGGSGNDIISGGAGRDTIRGGAGDDKLTGDDEHDHVYGDAGNDILDGGNGNDSVVGGLGDDRVYGGFGDDSLQGNDGNDRLAGGDGRDRLYGGNGNDFLFGDAGNDYIRGDNGDDHIRGGAGDDTIDGGRGINLLDGDEGNDRLRNGSQVELDLDYLATLIDRTGSGALASAFYEADTEISGEERLFELSVTGLSAAAGAEVNVYVDGDRKGELTLDGNGNGKLVFREVPKNPGELPFPYYFDIIATSMIVLTSDVTGAVLMEGTFLLLPSDN